MIALEKLRAVRTIVTHANCPDGTASALILHDALPEARVVFAQYGTAELAALEPDPGMLFCDFSPPADRAAAFVAAGAICLDHHKTARAVIESFGELGVYADNEGADVGVSGALLAWRHVWRPLRVFGAAGCSRYHEDAVQDFAWLAGVRDTWQRDNGRWLEACEQAEALRFWPWERLAAEGVVELDDLLEIGPVLVARHAAAVATAIKEALRFDADGCRVVVLGNVETVSDAADVLGAEADLVIGFRYLVDGGTPKLVLSCRSRGDFDVAAFCRLHGGGGHTKAAGCTLPFVIGSSFDGAAAASPYETIWNLVRNYRARRFLGAP